MGGVPWHTMCPVIFAPTVPVPGRFLFRFFIPYTAHCLSHGIFDFRFLILYAEPCLSHAFPFFVPLSSAPPAQAGSLRDAYRYFNVPMRMHSDIPMY